LELVGGSYFDLQIVGVSGLVVTYDYRFTSDRLVQFIARNLNGENDDITVAIGLDENGDPIDGGIDPQNPALVVDPHGLANPEGTVWVNGDVVFDLSNSNLGVRSDITFYYSNRVPFIDWDNDLTIAQNEANGWVAMVSSTLVVKAPAVGSFGIRSLVDEINWDPDRNVFNFVGVSDAGRVSGTSQMTANIDTGEPEIKLVEYQIRGETGWTAIAGNAFPDIWFGDEVFLKFTVSSTGDLPGDTWNGLVQEGGSYGNLSIEKSETVGGKFVVTYVYHFIANREVKFVATNLNGEKDEITVNIGMGAAKGGIDIINPSLLVATTTASKDGSVWVNTDKEQVLFGLSNPNGVVSGVTYYYSTRAAAVAWNSAWTETQITANGWNKITGSSFEVKANEWLAASNRYHFIAVSDARRFSSIDTWVVNIDTQEPTITIIGYRTTETGASSAMPGGLIPADTWFGSSVWIEFTVTYTGAVPTGIVPQGAGFDTQGLTMNGGSYARLAILDVSGFVVRYLYRFDANGSVDFAATNRNGKTDGVIVTVSTIETTPPAFTVQSAHANTNGTIWRNDDVRFDFTLTATINSGVTYYWANSVLNWPNAGWTPISTSSGHYLVVDSEQADGVEYYFIAVSKAGIPSVVSGRFIVNIDRKTPIAEMVGYRIGGGAFIAGDETTLPVPPDYQTVSITVYFNITTFLAPTEITKSGLSGNFTTSSETGYTHYFIFDRNGTITVTVSARNGESDFVTVNIATIDIISPDLAVSASVPGGKHDVFDSTQWATDNITFTLRVNHPEELPLYVLPDDIGHYVEFYYIQSTDRPASDLALWDWRLIGIGADTTKEFTSIADNGTYWFMARTATGNSTIYADRAYVRIDKDAPIITYAAFPVNPETGLTAGGLTADEAFLASLGTEWFSNEVLVRLQVQYSSTQGTFGILTTGATLVDWEEVDAQNQIYIYTVRISVNTATQFRAINTRNNLQNTFTVPAMPLMDRVTPSITRVTATNANTWTSDTVRFDFIYVVGPSGVKEFQYAKSNLTGDALNDYLNDDANWEMIPKAANGDLRDWMEIDGEQEIHYYFRVVSNVGAVSARTTSYNVRIDYQEPTVTLLGYSIGRDGTFEPTPSGTMPPAGSFWTNADEIRIFVKITYGNSGGEYDMPIPGAGGRLLQLTAEHGATHYFDFTDNGSITLRANSGANITSDALFVEVSYISRILPEVTTTVRGDEFLGKAVNAKSFNTGAQVFINNFDAMEVTVLRDGVDITDRITFAHGRANLNNNGLYTIRAIDIAGNYEEIFFTIAEPPYVLIVGSSVGAAALIGVGAWFAVLSTRRKKALTRLTANTSDSDDSNQFVLYKKAK